jgi:aminopeptidase-like protein
MRTKYGEYKEYHTSLDDLNYISEEGLLGAYEIYIKIISIFENNRVYKNLILCEPQMGRRGLYPTISTKETMGITRNMMNVLTYADGKNDLIDIANILNINIENLYNIVKELYKEDLLQILE